jgi:hypothetical protein
MHLLAAQSWRDWMRGEGLVEERWIDSLNADPVLPRNAIEESLVVIARPVVSKKSR